MATISTCTIGFPRIGERGMGGTRHDQRLQLQTHGLLHCRLAWHWPVLPSDVAAGSGTYRLIAAAATATAAPSPIV